MRLFWEICQFSKSLLKPLHSYTSTKFRKSYTSPAIRIKVKPLKMVLCSSWWCPFQKEKRAGLQFTSPDFSSLLLTPLRFRWTIPLKGIRGTQQTYAFPEAPKNPFSIAQEGLYHSWSLYLIVSPHLFLWSEAISIYITVSGRESR